MEGMLSLIIQLSTDIDHKQWQQDLREGMLQGLQEIDAGGSPAGDQPRTTLLIRL